MLLNRSLFTLISALLFAACGEIDAPSALQPAPPSEADVWTDSDVLVFRDETAMGETLNRLNKMSRAEILNWNRAMSFVSLRQIFDEVVEAEWAVSNYYETLPPEDLEAMGGVPTQPVYSQAYLDALKNGYIRLIDEGHGEYFDYNISDPNLAPILSPEGKVVVGGVLRQFALGVTQEAATTALYINSSNSWAYYSKPGNDWTYDGSKKRYRAWVEGSSRVETSSVSGNQYLYNTNQLRIQAMQKNIWGNWKFNDSYACQFSISWDWYYRLDNIMKTNLIPGNGPPASLSSPASDDFGGYSVNNAIVPLVPHTYSSYVFPPLYDCGGCCLCGDVEAAVILPPQGSIVINGWTLTLSH